MAYTATKFLSPRAFQFPKGIDNTQHLVFIRGNLWENDTATEYAVGGIVSTSFEVTAFSAVGLVTYALLKGMPLVNGQLVVISNTASNTNDGTYIVSAITPSSSSAGTFVALPGPTAISGTGQTAQTAQGVGQIQWGAQQFLPQTFTATAVTVSGGVMTVTYTTLTGPQLQIGDTVTLAGMTNAGNNGTFSLNSVTRTSSTGGSFKVNNTGAVASDSGTGTGNFNAGISAYNTSAQPLQVTIFSYKGWIYVWNRQNQTIQIFTTGTASGDVLNEAALGASVTYDGDITFEVAVVRSNYS